MLVVMSPKRSLISHQRIALRTFLMSKPHPARMALIFIAVFALDIVAVPRFYHIESAKYIHNSLNSTGYTFFRDDYLTIEL